MKDWEQDDDNKRLVGGDLLGGRPTVLLALALENLKDEQRAELLDLVNGRTDLSSEQRVLRARALYFEAGVFTKAYQLVDKHQQKAEEVADEIQPDELRRLMYYLVDTVLDHSAEGEAHHRHPAPVVQRSSSNCLRWAIVVVSTWPNL